MPVPCFLELFNSSRASPLYWARACCALDFKYLLKVHVLGGARIFTSPNEASSDIVSMFLKGAFALSTPQPDKMAGCFAQLCALATMNYHQLMVG